MVDVCLSLLLVQERAWIVLDFDPTLEETKIKFEVFRRGTAHQIVKVLGGASVGASRPGLFYSVPEFCTESFDSS